MNQRPVWPPFSLNTPQPLGQRHALAPRPILSIFASHPGHQALSKIPIFSPHNAFPFRSYSIPQFGQNHPPGVDPPSMVLLQSGQYAGNAASRTLDQKPMIVNANFKQINITTMEANQGAPSDGRSKQRVTTYMTHSKPMCIAELEQSVVECNLCIIWAEPMFSG